MEIDVVTMRNNKLPSLLYQKQERKERRDGGQEGRRKREGGRGRERERRKDRKEGQEERKEGRKKVKEERNWIDIFRGIPLVQEKDQRHLL